MNKLAHAHQPASLVLNAVEQDWFLALPSRERVRIQQYLRLFDRLEKAPAIKHEARAIAREQRISAKTLMDLHRKFRQQGRDPRCLVRKWNNGKSGQPQKFIKFWVALCGENKRQDGTKGAYRRLVQEFWAAGESVPGYGTWQQWYLKTFPNKPLPPTCPTDRHSLPDGWSYENLCRYLPKESIVVAMRQGLKAAHDHQKYLKRDRSKLRPMELIAIDDFWLDQLFYSAELGLDRPFRAVGLLARDVATGCVVGWFLKPRTEDEFGRKASIRQGEVDELLRLILMGQGLPPYPVTILAENKSATVTPRTRQLLDAHFGDRIRVEYTGLYNFPLLANGFPERGGKPWEKTWVESYIRLIHTTAGHLPAQTGNRYDNAPGNQYELIKYTEKFLKHPDLTREDIKKLRLPMLSLEDAQRIYGGLLDLLEHRTDHKMQGFDTVTLWRREKGDPWVSEEQIMRLPPEQLLQAEKWTRLETSAERWQRMCPPRDQWTEVPPSLLWYLMPSEKETRIEDGYIRFSDKRISHERLEFWQENNRLLREHEGKKVIAHYTPDDPSRVILTTPGPELERTVLGVVPRDNAIDMTDPEALERAGWAIGRDRMREISTIRELTKSQDDRLARDREVNSAIVHLAKERKKAPQIAFAQQDAALEDLSHHYPQPDIEDEDPLDQL